MRLTDAEVFAVEKLQSELSEKLYYHGVHHTLDVAEATERIAKAEGIVDEETGALLRTAALFHDIGFVNTYQGHEAESCRMAREYLPGFGYEPRQIALICGMIDATRTPQSPKNILEEIICDADLDYLGRSDYEAVAYSLFREMHERDLVEDEEAWNATQIKFLDNHHYWTHYSKTVRQPAKYRHIMKLRELSHTQG